MSGRARPTVTLSAVDIMQESPDRWVARWYDYTGHEYAHVTKAWLEEHFGILAQVGGGTWKAKIRCPLTC